MFDGRTRRLVTTRHRDRPARGRGHRVSQIREASQQNTSNERATRAEVQALQQKIPDRGPLFAPRERAPFKLLGADTDAEMPKGGNEKEKEKETEW